MGLLRAVFTAWIETQWPKRGGDVSLVSLARSTLASVIQLLRMCEDGIDRWGTLLMRLRRFHFDSDKLINREEDRGKAMLLCLRSICLPPRAPFLRKESLCFRFEPP